MNVRKRGLALLMCICMIFTLLPFSAFADATENASPLNIEYWCTNQPVNVSGHSEKTVTFWNGDVNDSYKVYYSDISAQLSDNSLKFLSAIAPASVSTSDTYALNNGSKVDVPFNYIYWKTMVQSGNDVQTGKAGSNTTSNGTEIISIQKTDNGYVYYSAANMTTPVNITSDMHIVCYYKQVLAQSDDIGSITGSDWGWPANKDGGQSQIAKEKAAKLKVTYQIKVIDDDSVKASQIAYYNVFNNQTNGGTIKDINVTPAFGYEVVKVDIKHDDVSQKSKDTTINATEGSIPDQTLNRNEGSLTVIYYLKPIEKPTLSFKWIGEAPEGYNEPAGKSCTKGEKITTDVIYDEYKIGDEVKTPEHTYTFKGWYKDLATKEIINSDFEINGDTILYGEWTSKANEYNVTYEVTGDIPNGYNAPADSTAAFGSTVTVEATPDLTKYSGYKFTGWVVPVGVTVGEDGKFIMPAEDVEFTGEWTKEVSYASSYTVKHYWIGDKAAVERGEDIDPLFPMTIGGQYEVGQTVTYTGTTGVAGYTALPNILQQRSVVISDDESQNVIYIYHSKNITVTADNDKVTYDGDKHEVTTFKATVNDGGKDVTAELKDEIIAHVEGTDVGEYDVKLSYYLGVPQRSAGEAGGVYDDLKTNMFVCDNLYYVTKVVPGKLIINPLEVTITGNNKEVYYNGTEQTFDTGYTVKGLLEDHGHKIDDSLIHTLTGKEVKQYAGKFNQDAIDIVIYYFDESVGENVIVSDNYIVNLIPGTLTIKARPVTPPVVKRDLTITAGSKTGIAPVTCDEYTVEGLANGDVVASVKITGSQNEPGESANVASDAVIKNSAGVDVTKNYNIKYVDGVLKAIEPLNKEEHFNYIIGVPDGTVKPLANISRAEVATIFFRLLTDEARDMYSVTTSSFSDVANGVWYTRAIATLANAGILKGDPAGTFRPADPITRAEMAAVIARFAKLDVNTKTFSDIDGHWAKDYIELAAGNGWINGTPEGEFQPDRNITRAETVAMINRVLDRQTENVSDLLPADQMTTWSDNMDTTQWYYKDMQEATNYHKCERVGDSIYEKWTEKLPEIDWASYQI